MTLDELERLHQAATPGPWAEFCDGGDWWVGRADEDGGPTTDPSVCASDAETWTQQADIDLTIAARNALPALLRVARAAEQVACDLEAELRARYDGTLDYPVMRDKLARDMESVDELRAALAALEAANA